MDTNPEISSGPEALKTKQYNCYIEKVEQDTFTARCYNEKDEPYEIVIYKSAVKPEDTAFIKPGANFKWTISSIGSGEPDSDITFRHYKPLTEDELIEALEEAREIRTTFGWTK